MRRYLNFWVILGGLGIAVLLILVVLTYLLVVQPAAPGSLPPDTAAMTLIPAPSSTPRFPSPTATSILPTLEPTPTLLPGSFGIGAFVQISGTGGSGLNIRSAPGLNSALSFGAAESEVFQITDGPQEVDGYTWWFLTAPYDLNRAGWAVQNYLTVITSP